MEKSTFKELNNIFPQESFPRQENTIIGSWFFLSRFKSLDIDGKKVIGYEIPDKDKKIVCSISGTGKPSLTLRIAIKPEKANLLKAYQALSEIFKKNTEDLDLVVKMITPDIKQKYWDGFYFDGGNDRSQMGKEICIFVHKVKGKKTRNFDENNPKYDFTAISKTPEQWKQFLLNIWQALDKAGVEYGHTPPPSGDKALNSEYGILTPFSYSGFRAFEDKNGRKNEFGILHEDFPEDINYRKLQRHIKGINDPIKPIVFTYDDLKNCNLLDSQAKFVKAQIIESHERLNVQFNLLIPEFFKLLMNTKDEVQVINTEDEELLNKTEKLAKLFMSNTSILKILSDVVLPLSQQIDYFKEKPIPEQKQALKKYLKALIEKDYMQWKKLYHKTMHVLHLHQGIQKAKHKFKQSKESENYTIKSTYPPTWLIVTLAIVLTPLSLLATIPLRLYQNKRVDREIAFKENIKTSLENIKQVKNIKVDKVKILNSLKEQTDVDDLSSESNQDLMFSFKNTISSKNANKSSSKINQVKTQDRNKLVQLKAK